MVERPKDMEDHQNLVNRQGRIITGMSKSSPTEDNGQGGKSTASGSNT